MAIVPLGHFFARQKSVNGIYFSPPTRQNPGPATQSGTEKEEERTMSSIDFDKPSLTERAYQQIRNDILVGKLPPGHKLVVNDLVEEWKISATPIKEALNRLVSEELVEVVPRRGMRVKTYNADDLRDIFEIRQLYEAHCCRLAVEKIDDHPEVLEELTSTLEKLRSLLGDEHNFIASYHLDEIFHMLIVGLCGNRKMIRDYDRLHANIISLSFFIRGHSSPLWRQRATYDEHEAILKGLVNRSVGEMESAMRRHLENTAQDTLRFFGRTIDASADVGGE